MSREPSRVRFIRGQNSGLAFPYLTNALATYPSSPLPIVLLRIGGALLTSHVISIELSPQPPPLLLSLGPYRTEGPANMKTQFHPFPEDELQSTSVAARIKTSSPYCVALPRH